MNTWAVIFPGQGAQAVGMGRDVYASSPRAREVYDRASRVLGFDVARVCFEGPCGQLEQTDVQQPAIFVTSVALWEAYLEAGGSLASFGRAAGLSLGEYTALHAAGAVGFEDCLNLVRHRGVLMQKAAQARPSGMVSLVGADEHQANAICENARGDDVLVPANFNCPGQIVLAGSKAACARAMAAAEEAGCRAVSLAVAGAFHSPIMAPAAEGLLEQLDKTEFLAPQIPVVANVDAKPHGDAASIRNSLARQLTHPVLWQKSVEHMIADGMDRFIEVGPGRVLTGLMRKISRSVNAINISTAESLAAAMGQAAAAP